MQHLINDLSQTIGALKNELEYYNLAGLGNIPRYIKALNEISKGMQTLQTKTDCDRDARMLKAIKKQILAVSR
jgi:hypothetical protein